MKIPDIYTKFCQSEYICELLLETLTSDDIVLAKNASLRRHMYYFKLVYYIKIAILKSMTQDLCVFGAFYS